MTEETTTAQPELVPFALRLPKKLHKDLKILAALRGMSTNSLAVEAIQNYADSNGKVLAMVKGAKKQLT